MSRAPRLGSALAALLLACGGSESAQEPAPPPVSIVPVSLEDVTERIEATGELVARDRARIAAEVSGRVTEVAIDEGAAAAAGDVLLRIDPERRELELRSARARAAEARAALEEQRREAERVARLFHENVASRAQLDDAETQLDLARSRLDAAQAQLGVALRARRDSDVKAPFAGMVAERLVSPGEFVSVGQALVELVALDPIEVEFHLPEVDSSRVSAGNEVSVFVSPYPHQVFYATVTFVSPTIDPRSRTLRVKGAIANSDGRLRPGLFARVDLGVSERKQVPLIPEEAILQRSDGAVVFRLVEGDRVERRRVETGLWTDGKVEVTDGLSGNDRVVIRGHAALLDGSRVSVRNPDGSPAVAVGAREVATP